MRIIILSSLFVLHSNIFAQDLHLIQQDSLKEVNGFFLKDTYQNPFGSVSYIEFNIPKDCNVKVFITKVQDLRDDEKNSCTDTLNILYNGKLKRGFYILIWNLTDKNNNQVENGYYNCFIAASFDDKIYKMDFQGNTRIIVMR